MEKYKRRNLRNITRFCLYIIVLRYSRINHNILYHPFSEKVHVFVFYAVIDISMKIILSFSDYLHKAGVIYRDMKVGQNIVSFVMSHLSP